MTQVRLWVMTVMLGRKTNEYEREYQHFLIFYWEK